MNVEMSEVYYKYMSDIEYILLTKYKDKSELPCSRKK